MTEKTDHKTIAAALAAAQSEMGRAKKSANNPHFKSKYADLDAVCDAAMPSLNKHGIAVVQPMQPMGDDWVVLTRFIHGASGEVLETPVPLILGKRDMQGLGSAMTYARRYGLMALAGIAPEDDDGNAAVASGPAPAPRKAPPFNARAAAERIKASIEKAATLDDLIGVWKADRDALAQIKRADDDVYGEVERAKDDRKAALEKPADNADLGGDEIPY